LNSHMNQKPVSEQQNQSREIKDIHVSDDWLRLLYSEAWKQYIHEDAQGQTRMNIFLTVQAALIAILAAISKPLLDMPPKQVGSHQVYIGVGILGLVAVIIGFFSLVLGARWKSVTEAGRLYLNLRWIPIAAIEKSAQLNDINLAGLENAWRKHSKENSGTDFHPYATIAELSEFRLRPLPNIRGWSAISGTITSIQILFLLIMIGGFFLLGITLYLWLCR